MRASPMRASPRLMLALDLCITCESRVFDAYGCGTGSCCTMQVIPMTNVAEAPLKASTSAVSAKHRLAVVVVQMGMYSAAAASRIFAWIVVPPSEALVPLCLVETAQTSAAAPLRT